MLSLSLSPVPFLPPSLHPAVVQALIPHTCPHCARIAVRLCGISQCAAFGRPCSKGIPNLPIHLLIKHKTSLKKTRGPPLHVFHVQPPCIPDVFRMYSMCSMHSYVFPNIPCIPHVFHVFLGIPTCFLICSSMYSNAFQDFTYSKHQKL